MYKCKKTGSLSLEQRQTENCELSEAPLGAEFLRGSDLEVEVLLSCRTQVSSVLSS